MPNASSFEFITATITPFTTDGRIDLAAIEPYVDYLSPEGFRRVFVNGTTDESLSLSTDERIQLADAWTRRAKDQLNIMVHVGHNRVHEAERMTPTFFRPRNADELKNFPKPIAADSVQLTEAR